MKTFDPSDLWRISDFRRARSEGRFELEDVPGRATLLPTTLLTDLRRIRSDPTTSDVLEVIAACLRHHEPALLYLEQGQFVWPVTLFPREALYHSPRSAEAMAATFALSQLRLVSAEPPGVRPPGSILVERVASPEKYHPLAGLVWTVALHGPRGTLPQRDQRPRRLPRRRHRRPRARPAAAEGRDQLDRRAPRAALVVAQRNGALARHEHRAREPHPERALPLGDAARVAGAPGGARSDGGMAAAARAPQGMNHLRRDPALTSR
jgi:hypothetical protein